VTQTPPAPTDNGGNPPRRGGVRYAVLAVAVLVMVAGILVARGFGGSPALEPPSSATTATSAIPTSASPTTAASAEQTAVTETTKVLNSWIASYATAYALFDATKLDSSLATPEVLAAAKANLDQLRNAAADGVTAKYTAQIKDVKAATFTADALTTSVCALRDVRFIKGGQDVTVDEGGKPYPPRVQPTWQTVEYSGGPGAWKISKIDIQSDAGPSC